MAADLSGRTALVTGAASGLGAAIAERLAQAGARVVVSDRHAAPGLAFCQRLAGDGHDVDFVEHDVADGTSWQRALRHVREGSTALDILVNNAGIQQAKSIEEADLDDLRAHMRVNLGGVHLGTVRGIAAMAQRAGRPAGAIVNVISTYGLVGEEFNAPYCASKGAAQAVTQAAARYCRERRLPVRVNAVHPGCIMTPLVEREHRETLAKLPGGNAAALWEEWRLEHPIGRLGRPADIAAAVLFLVSDGAAAISGLDLPVDGGYLAQ
ncbi:MAG: SDR family oxidoreductase [Rhodospirillaceae bacterium]|nr:SDR family oxidoreductase [Rhodospirillaceae bacterium]